MRYADLEMKYPEPIPVARSRHTGKVVFAVGESHGLQYGYLGEEDAPYGKLLEHTKVRLVDVYFKAMPLEHWRCLLAENNKLLLHRSEGYECPMRGG